MHNRFRRLATAAADAVGTPWAFLAALGLVILWAAAGPLLRYSSQWQLLINTTTTVVTFLIVFLLQSTQNRHAVAVQIKLDELLRAVQGARTRLVNLEELSDEELAQLHAEFQRLRTRLNTGAGETSGEPEPASESQGTTRTQRGSAPVER
jgi:low affinity Fe/Cu permease